MPANFYDLSAKFVDITHLPIPKHVSKVDVKEVSAVGHHDVVVVPIGNAEYPRGYTISSARPSELMD